MKSNVVEFDTPEAAHQAAWILYGQYIEESKVAIPPFNANSETLNVIAAQIGSRWRWVVVSKKTIRMTICEWIFDYFYQIVDAEVDAPIIKIHILFAFAASRLIALILKFLGYSLGLFYQLIIFTVIVSIPFLIKFISRIND